MTCLWRSLVLAAVCVMTAGVVQAQTVMVRNAPQGSTIELVLNAATVATVPAKPGAETTLTLPPMEGGPKAKMDVRFWVDYCENMRRVFVVEAGLFPSTKDVGCDRKEVAGVYLAQAQTTFVVDVTGTSPSVWLRQGAVPSNWLGAGPMVGPSGAGLQPRPGILVGGGFGFSNLKDFALVQCGNLSSCSGNSPKFTWEAGASVWVFPFVGVEFSYVKPAVLTLEGVQSPLTATTTFDSNLMRLVAKGGPSFGPVRLYGLAGENYHRATTTTTQTMADQSLPQADGSTVVIKGGTQIITMKTAGWGLVAGGGAEFWMNSRLLLYAEVSRSWIQGYTTDNSGIEMNDRKWSYMMGVRYRVGRK